MAEERPTRSDIDRGTTVRITQDADNNPGEPIIRDVRHIITEDETAPGGIEVELQSGATGRVLEVHPDEDDRDLPQGGS